MNDPLASGRERWSDFVLVIRWLAQPASIVAALRAGVMQAERRKPSGSYLRPKNPAAGAARLRREDKDTGG
jgi:hypothetical protein